LFKSTPNKPRRLADVPKAVVQRYMRRRLRSSAHEVARVITRWRLPRLEKERKKALEDAFEAAKYYAIRNEHGPFPAVTLLFNIGLYLLLAERDIQALKIDALTHPDEWTRKLHARIILLTIYEWDGDSVTGRGLKAALDAIEVSDALKAQTVDALRALRLVQRKIAREYKFVRNAAIAHRDPNALVQYRAIRDLDVERVFATAIEFFQAVEQFMPVLTSLLRESATLPALLRQWTPRDQASVEARG
jgi:hypothetical protein